MRSYAASLPILAAGRAYRLLAVTPAFINKAELHLTAIAESIEQRLDAGNGIVNDPRHEFGLGGAPSFRPTPLDGDTFETMLCGVTLERIDAGGDSARRTDSDSAGATRLIGTDGIGFAHHDHLYHGGSTRALLMVNGFTSYVAAV